MLYTRFAEFPYHWPLDVLEGVLESQPDARLVVIEGTGHAIQLEEPERFNEALSEFLRQLNKETP